MKLQRFIVAVAVRSVGSAIKSHFNWRSSYNDGFASDGKYTVLER